MISPQPAPADALTLYGEPFASRVLLGTSRYPSLQSLSDSIAAARPGMITVALRRQMSDGGGAQAGFFDLLKRHGVPLLPNTAGLPERERSRHDRAHGA